MDDQYYYIMTFDTTTDVLQAEGLLKLKFPISVMPIPQEISSGCGLALRLMGAENERIEEHLHTFPVNGTLYRMKTAKENGHYAVEKIMTF